MGISSSGCSDALPREGGGGLRRWWTPGRRATSPSTMPTSRRLSSRQGPARRLDNSLPGALGPPINAPALAPAPASCAQYGGRAWRPSIGTPSPVLVAASLGEARLKETAWRSLLRRRAEDAASAAAKSARRNRGRQEFRVSLRGPANGCVPSRAARRPIAAGRPQCPIAPGLGAYPPSRRMSLLVPAPAALHARMERKQLRNH